MKRVGIITYRDIQEGKGRFLQAYALYSAISDLGYNVEIIDYALYRNNTLQAKVLRYMSGDRKLIPYLAELPNFVFKFLNKKNLNKKKDNYLKFIEQKIKMSKRYTNYADLLRLADSYDVFVCGSDQIWNPKFLSRDPAYFLQFVEKNKRIAYAPSIGTNLLNKEEKDFLLKKMETIKYLSVREQSTATLFNETGRINVKTVLDPTFLMERKWWLDFASQSNEEGEYILTFFFDNSSFPRKKAEEIARKYNCKIVNLQDTLRDNLCKEKKYLGIGPEKFVSLFKNARFVCTQSFHGTVLSILYNKPFYVFDRITKHYIPGVFTRIEDLLKIFQLEERIIRNESIPLTYAQIDYENVNKIIQEKRNESLGFLYDSLNAVIEEENFAG